MEIVLGTEEFASIGGSETYLLTTAEHLGRLGHQVTIYANQVGEMAREAWERGVPVTGRLDELPPSCDALITQFATVALALADRYPRPPHVFVAHSGVIDAMLPPQVEGVVNAVVVMNERVRRRIEALAVRRKVVRLRQPIDMDRFSPRGAARDEARAVLLLGNYLRGPRRTTLVDALDELGLEYSQVGAHGVHAHPHPELEIADADIVVGYGRVVLEAMASGRAAYVYDHSGGDGWITKANYDGLEANGFAGSATPDAIDTSRLVADLARYDPQMGLVNRELARMNHDARTHAVALVEVLEEVADDRSAAPSPLRELERLVRAGWRAEGEAGLLRVEVQMLRERTTALERAIETERELAEEQARRAAEFERALIELYGTRRYRIGDALVAPVDALRRVLRRKSPG
jgi:hypothetical protein